MINKFIQFYRAEILRDSLQRYSRGKFDGTYYYEGTVHGLPSYERVKIDSFCSQQSKLLSKGQSDNFQEVSGNVLLLPFPFSVSDQFFSMSHAADSLNCQHNVFV